MAGHDGDGGVQIDRARLRQDGYVLLRGAIPGEWLDALRTAFDDGASAAWPVPRGPGFRHSLLDLDPTVQAVCRLPAVIEAVGTLCGERFFLSQVEGREPLRGCGHQGLHRDLCAQRPGDSVQLLAFFDDYGPGNGATRLVPATHRLGPDAPAPTETDEARAVRLSGRAGDVLVFDADLMHAGSLNPSGERRRSILACYFAESLHEGHALTAAVRNVRMDTSERFDPPETRTA